MPDPATNTKTPVEPREHVYQKPQKWKGSSTKKETIPSMRKLWPCQVSSIISQGAFKGKIEWGMGTSKKMIEGEAIAKNIVRQHWGGHASNL